MKDYRRGSADVIPNCPPFVRDGSPGKIAMPGFRCEVNRNFSPVAITEALEPVGDRFGHT